LTTYRKPLQMPKDTIVFISYAKEDYEIAKRLHDDLKKAGAKPWLGQENILPGQTWKKEIDKAIKKSSYFIALMSNNSISKKGYVQKELKIALDMRYERPYLDIFLIPVKIDNCIPKDERLTDLHWADFNISYESGFNDICKILNLRKKQKAKSASKPNPANPNLCSVPFIPICVWEPGIEAPASGIAKIANRLSCFFQRWLRTGSPRDEWQAGVRTAFPSTAWERARHYGESAPAGPGSHAPAWEPGGLGTYP